MNGNAMNSLLEQLDKLPPMPAVALKVLAIVRKPETTVKDIMEVIRLDEMLTMRVLKMANSAYYNRNSMRIATLEEALTRLGNNALVNLVLADSCQPYFGNAGEGYDLRRGELWRHSVACALLSQRLADKSGLPHREQLFTACILHDIGKTLLDSYVKERRDDLRKAASSGVTSFTKAEMEVFGMSHAELGARVLEKWEFPLEIVSAVRYHHEPDRAVNVRRMAFHVYMSDLLCLMVGIGLGLDGLNYESQAEAFSQFNFSEAELQRLLAGLLEELEKAEEFLRV